MNQEMLKIAGAILGPVAGFLGTLAKSWYDKHAAEKSGDRAIAEIDRLLDYSATLDKLNALPAPPPQLAEARRAIDDSIAKAVARVVPALSQIEQRKTGQPSPDRGRGVLSRILLLYRPRSGWLWLLHGFFYILIGIDLLASLGFVLAFEEDRKELWSGMIGLGFFAAIAVVCNLIANRVDRKKAQIEVAAGY